MNRYRPGSKMAFIAEQEAKEDCDKMNKEVKGKVFTVEKDSSKEYIK